MSHSSVPPARPGRARFRGQPEGANPLGVLGLAPALIYAGVGAALLSADFTLLHASTVAFLVAAAWSYRARAGCPSRGETSPKSVSKFVFAGLAVYGALTLSVVATGASGWPVSASFGLSVALGSVASVIVNQLIRLAPAYSDEQQAAPPPASGPNVDIS